MTKISEIKIAMKKNPLTTFMLVLGILIEISNHNSLFYDFVKVLNPEYPFWLNHIIAMFFAMFFCTAIVSTGFDKAMRLSWFLAMLTVVISFGVYSKIGLDWSDTNKYGSIHAAIVMSAFLLPLLVAYGTHRIANDINYVAEKQLSKAEEITSLVNDLNSIINALPTNMVAAKQVRLNHSNGTMIEEEEEKSKKKSPLLTNFVARS